MHEGKHGLLDGVDDIDAIFGTEEDRPCTCERKLERCICDDEHEHEHSHEHEHK